MEKPRKDLIGTIYKALGIAAVIVGVILWLAATNATATHADNLAIKNAADVEKKADKQDVKEGFQRIYDKLDKMNDYLLQQAQRDHR